MMEPVGQTHPRQCFRGVHGVGADLGDQLDIFQRSEAGDEIVKLKNKAHMLTSELGQGGIVRLRQIMIQIVHATARGRVEATQNIEQS